MSKSITRERVFDCFIFYDELDVLEIRLNVLDPIVDCFVIVESEYSFRGNKKPLYFYDNRERFDRFLGKIRHIVLGEDMVLSGHDAWGREFYQRNSIMRGLTDCLPNDLIMISDVDEIINPKVLVDICFFRNVLLFRQKCYYYYLNCESTEVISKAKMVRFGDLKSPQWLRDYPKVNYHGKNSFKRKVIKYIGSLLKKFRTYFGFMSICDDGGWHFTYIKDYSSMSHKISNFSHSEYDVAEYVSEDKIKSRIDGLKDPFDRGNTLRIVELDDTFPEYIVSNKDRLSNMLYKGGG